MAVLAALLAALLDSICQGDVGLLALCSVYFVFGSMLYVWRCLYQAYSAELGCIYLWILGLSKHVKSLLGGHAGCDLIF